MKLSEKQKKHLRKIGHSLKPIVTIADQGLKETIIQATEEALDFHELIKIRLRVGDRDERNEILETLTRQTNSTIIAKIGFIALIYRKNPKAPKIKFS